MTNRTITGFEPGEESSTDAGNWGYVCPMCGMWVSYGETHICNSGITYHPQPSSDDKWDEVLDLLRSIEDKLARIK